MKEILDGLVAKINAKIATNEKYREKLSKVNKTFCVDFDGSDFYNFKLEAGKVSEVLPGKIDADVTIEVGSEIFKKILNGEEDPMVAYLEKKIRIKASLMDKLLINDLLK